MKPASDPFSLAYRAKGKQDLSEEKKERKEKEKRKKKERNVKKK